MAVEFAVSRSCTSRGTRYPCSSTLILSTHVQENSTTYVHRNEYSNSLTAVWVLMLPPSLTPSHFEHSFFWIDLLVRFAQLPSAQHHTGFITRPTQSSISNLHHPTMPPKRISKPEIPATATSSLRAPRELPESSQRAPRELTTPILT